MSEVARGGVAIILTSYFPITDMEPWNETHWTPHWMVVQFDIRGKISFVVSVYVPTAKAERDAICASTSPAGTRRISFSRR